MCLSTKNEITAMPANLAVHYTNLNPVNTPEDEAKIQLHDDTREAQYRKAPPLCHALLAQDPDLEKLSPTKPGTSRRN